MAHYAFLDSNNIVTEVIVGKDETDTSYNLETYYGDVRGVTSKRTSYNTQGGSHILGGTPFRKNYAGIGYTLNETSCLWEAPVAYPDDGEMYIWNEQTTEWNLVSEQTPE